MSLIDDEIAMQFAEHRIIPCQTNIHGEMAVRYAHDAAMDMAEYKDECFRSFLKEKYNLWMDLFLKGNDAMKIKICGVQEIYEDYFGESIDEPD